MNAFDTQNIKKLNIYWKYENKDMLPTPYYRPPSVDRLEETKPNACPSCGYADPEIIAGRIDVQIECFACKTRGPDRANYELAMESWNSIPRKSEVRELLDAIDRAASEEDPLMADVLFMSALEKADKLRKEWNL